MSVDGNTWSYWPHASQTTCLTVVRWRARLHGSKVRRSICSVERNFPPHFQSKSIMSFRDTALVYIYLYRTYLYIQSLYIDVQTIYTHCRGTLCNMYVRYLYFLYHHKSIYGEQRAIKHVNFGNFHIRIVRWSAKWNNHRRAKDFTPIWDYLGRSSHSRFVRVFVEPYSLSLLNWRHSDLAQTRDTVRQRWWPEVTI